MEDKKEDIKQEEVVEEVKEEQVVEATPEEVEDEGVTHDFKISFDTFKEFYNQGGIKQTIKQAGIFCVIMALVIYFTSDRSDLAALFTRMGIYCGIIVVVTIANYFITNKLLLPKQYRRQGLENILINIKLNNKGIVQKIEDRSATISWASIVMAIETDISYIFYGANRSGFIFTKDPQMDIQEQTYISEMIKAKVVNYKRQESKKDKK